MSASIVPIKREKVLVTGPDMILIFWIARVALEDRDAYDLVKSELKLSGNEAARLYGAIRNFLGGENDE